MIRRMSARLVTMLCGVTAAGTTLFWLLFFFAPGTVQARETDVYLAFERAFPAADAWMAACCAAAAVGLARGRPWAAVAGIAGGSALVFLGLMDVLFDVEQGVYAEGSAAVAAEIVINAYCLTVGPILIAWFWRTLR